MDFDFLKNNSFTITNEDNDIKLLNGLLDKKENVLMLSGAVSSGKTSLCIDIANSHDGTVLYIDMKYSLSEHHKISQYVYLYRTNKYTDIINILNSFNKYDFDLIIIDGIANMEFLNSKVKRYDLFYGGIKEIIDKCANMKSSLILTNEINMTNSKSYCMSYQLKKLIGAQLLVKREINNNKISITVKNEKNGREIRIK